MFEISELKVIAEQMECSLQGKVIASGVMGNSPHKFVWYNRKGEEYASLVKGKRIGATHLMGRWLGLDLEPGYRFVFGEMGGKILLHPEAGEIPKKYHLLLNFTDGTALSVVIGLWGGLELYEAGEELKRDYIRDMAPTPLDPAFSREYFMELVQKAAQKGKRSVKSLLTQEQTLPGLGNSVAQEIMFRARLNPKRNIQELGEPELLLLHDIILQVVNEIIAKGGRSDEMDLYGKAGGYQRLMHSKAVGKPCPACGTAVQSMQYLGGACYFCPSCQK